MLAADGYYRHTSTIQDGRSETARVLMATGALVKAQANRRILRQTRIWSGEAINALADALQVAGLLVLSTLSLRANS